MARFKVVEEYTEFVTKYYEVDAESEDEAIEMVQNGDVAEDDCDISMGDSEFTIDEI
jgi:hypothetical protein